MTPGFWRLAVHPSLPSTSELCTRLAAEGEPEGLAVMALRQTAGRGSRGRGWESPEGNLYLSVLLRPAGTLADGGGWALIAALGMIEAVSGFVPDPARLVLKWPNDVLLDGRKLAGVRLDAQAKPDGTFDWLVMGCGINLAHAPDLPDRQAACLAEAAPPPAPRDVAEALLDRLANWRSVRMAEGLGPVRAAWLARAQTVGTALRLSYNGRVIGGSFAGLAEDGALLLATGGRVEAFSTGEVLLSSGNRPEG
ncbi:MAG: biotin--[acetyl-CoA-carboxylase] ligase [Proteobacteria bacterium]|nr:biotin--[acetyl-CoA-carboxylase] ligase [Pseudomonadota bacterium]